MHQRINITLPDQTLQLIDQAATEGNRSQFVDEAVRYYVDANRRVKLRAQLKESAIRRAQQDLSLAEEWFELEEAALSAAIPKDHG